MGLGSTSPVSTAFGSLALAGSVALGALDLVRRVAILGMIPIGAVGAWRLAKPLGSRRAQLTSLIVYVAIPVPYNAVSQGRWSGLILFAAAPWLLAALARAMHLEPFAPAPRAPDDAVGSPRREWLHRSLGLGLGLGVVATFVPAIVPVAILIAVGFALGSLVAGRVAGLGRLAGTVGVAALLTAVLQLPWTLGVVGPGGSWTALAGMRSGTDGWLSLGRILRFESGSYGAPPLGFAFLLAGALPLVIGRSWRFTWGARAWGSAVVCWAALWSGQQSWMPVPVPPAEVLLAPAAASLALAIACGTAAFDVDLPGYRFGWRQGASALAVLAVLVGSLPMIGGAADGRWRVPTADLGDVLDFIGTQRAAQPFRVVWAGDPDVVPAAGWRFSPTLDLAVSNDGMPTMTELWAPGGDTASKPLADALALGAERSDLAPREHPGDHGGPLPRPATTDRACALPGHRPPDRSPAPSWSRRPARPRPDAGEQRAGALPQHGLAERLDPVAQRYAERSRGVRRARPAPRHSGAARRRPGRGWFGHPARSGRARDRPAGGCRLATHGRRTSGEAGDAGRMGAGLRCAVRGPCRAQPLEVDTSLCCSWCSRPGSGWWCCCSGAAPACARWTMDRSPTCCRSHSRKARWCRSARPAKKTSSRSTWSMSANRKSASPTLACPTTTSLTRRARRRRARLWRA